ncbi:hypothetical protein BJX63DRAFT_432273 [Aspergillus granulosus]|uniref:Uncharacterized protein n=1 Tax=Aspergillus granulosus TaxID=176169 RepID=A0ABR4HCQ7_9EURO
MSLVASIPYRLASLGNLPVGRSLTVPSSLIGISRSMESVASPDDIWSAATSTPPGVYNIHQLVVRISPLLDAIVVRLGPDTARGPTAREVLIDGLQASLATTGRESTFPLTPSPQDRTRTEIIIQAHRIAKTIVSYVRDAPSREINPRLQIRSPCEGHLWTPAVAALLTGPRGNAQLLELYNEWLHRMILLRDSLLPFENFADVPLVIPESSSRGIRDFEEARKLFLVQCMTGAVQHQAIVDLAKVFTSRGLPRGGYGFQYAHGLVLPAFLSGSNSIHLLRYHPARLDDNSVDLLLDYEHKEYVNAPRTVLQNGEDDEDVKNVTKWNLSSLLPFDSCALQSSSIAIDSTHNDSRRRVVRLQLTLESGLCIAVDLGQITRGRRYAYELQVSGGSSKPNGTAPKTNGVEVQELPRTLVHKVADILSQPGLVISPRARQDQGSAIHVIPVADPIIKLALLGKLYPENVILVRDQDSIEAVTKTGKGFSERFVILDGQSAF